MAMFDAVKTHLHRTETARKWAFTDGDLFPSLRKLRTSAVVVGRQNKMSIRSAITIGVTVLMVIVVVVVVQGKRCRK